MKASDIPDRWFLQVVDMLSRAPMGLIWAPGAFGKPVEDGITAFRFEEADGKPRWVMRWDIERLYKIPEKLVLAKAKKLIGRGLMEGCYCGCRGDFELTDAGRVMLSYRP